MEIELNNTKSEYNTINDVEKLRERIKYLVNWMIWMETFKIKLMYLYIKIKKLLTVTKKVVLMLMNPVSEQTYNNTLIFAPSYLIYMFEWKKPKEGNKKKIQTIH